MDVREREAYHLVRDRDEFLARMEELSRKEILGVDFEGEWNLHRYGLHLCLTQISDRENIYLFDPLSVGDLAPFLALMEDPGLLKISHGPQSDIILLNYLFQSTPKNIWDTEKAAKLLDYESTSLGGLLERKFSIQKNTKVRAGNWNKRPLPEKMLSYAALDVEYLHDLYEDLKGELKEKGRLSWQEEECELLEDIRYKPKTDPHLDMNGANKLTDREAHNLKFLYELRERIAASLDKPAYHMISNRMLIDLARKPPRSAADWKELKGVHPRLGQYATDFHEAMEEARSSKPPRPVEPGRLRPEGITRKEYFQLVDQRRVLLDVVRERIENDFDISSQILSSRNVKRLSYGELSLEDLRNWQREIILETAGRLELDLVSLF